MPTPTEWLVDSESLHLMEVAARPEKITQAMITERAEVMGIAPGDLDDPRAQYEVVDGVATVRISGEIKWGGGKFAWLFGFNDAEQLAGVLEAVAEDRTAKAVIVEWHCPGGTFAGMDGLLSACDRLARAKPVEQIASELCASCAYWMASRLSPKLAATSSATVGNIGGVVVLEDRTGMLEKIGIKLKPLVTGARKLAGANIPPITAEHEAAMTERMNAAYSRFRDDVAVARGMTAEQIDALEGGAMYGPEAMAAGLVDRIVSLRDFRAEVIARYNPSAGGALGAPRAEFLGQSKERAMTLDELKKAQPELVATLEGLTPTQIKGLLAQVKGETAEEEEAPKGESEEEDQPKGEEAEEEPKGEEEEEEEPKGQEEDDEPKGAQAGGTTATASQLKGAFGDDPAFCFKAIEKGWSLDRAYREHHKMLVAENTRLRAKKAAAAEASGSADPVKPGAGGAGGGAGGAGGGGGSTLEKLAAEIKGKAEADSKPITMEQAMARAARQDPEAFEQYRERVHGRRAG